MYNLHDKMVEFHDDEVKLSEAEKKRLRNFKDLNIKRLNDGLAEINKEKNKSYALKDNVVQGSVAMSTVTQNDENDYDIDVAIIFDKDNILSSALDCRKLVEDALQRKCTNFVNPPKAGKNAVRVQYQEGYHIDFAVYRQYTENDEVIYEHAGPEWKNRHPRAIRDWFTKAVKEKSPNVENSWVTVKENQMRRIVRLLKMFSRSRSNWSLPGGVILTTLVEECYAPNDTRDDLAFYDTLVNIKNRINDSNDVKNPTNDELSLTPKENHKKKVTKLKEYIEDKLSCLEDLSNDNCTYEDAMKCWKKFFNHDFWKTESIQENSSFALKQQYASVYPEAYSLNVRYEIFDRNKIRKLAFRKSRRNEQLSPKQCTLYFEAIHNVQAPYQILWEVQNFGDEANEANHLYHNKSYNHTEGNYHWESTSYKGTHNMTVSIIKNGITVIKRTIDVRII
jgi:predicted nucleotidyltransferase